VNKRQGGSLLQNNNISGYVFILPWVVAFLAFYIIPVIMSFYYSFTRYNIFSPPRWIGVRNYVTMFFQDEKFWQSLKVTLFLVAMLVPLRLTFALAIAILLSRKHRFIGLYRAVYYIPSIVGGSVAIAVIWRQLFDRAGALNSLLNAVGIPSDVAWIGNPYTAIWTIILLMVWQFGSSMLIFLAGLKNIPATYYEAAVVDGANSWQKFSRITLPLLSNVIFFNLVMQTINGFLIFTQCYIITKGGPLDSTLVYALYLFRRAFSYQYLGYASALAWVLLVLIGGITLLLFRSSASWVYYESKGKSR
jgi:multiple sugar transport system permease protein